jgi:hypothetical protein
MRALRYALTVRYHGHIMLDQARYLNAVISSISFVRCQYIKSWTLASSRARVSSGKTDHANDTYQLGLISPLGIVHVVTRVVRPLMIVRILDDKSTCAVLPCPQHGS